MGITRRGLVLVAVLALSGCWLQPGFGPERQNSNPFESRLTSANVATLQQLWAMPGQTGSQPLVTPDGVYTAFVDTSVGHVLTVRAVERRTGVLRWQRDLPLVPGQERGAVLSVADDEVLVARLAPSSGFQFETLDPSTGSTIREVGVPLPFDPATVAIDGDVIAYRAADVTAAPDQLVVRRRATFELLWTAPTTPIPYGSGDPVLIHQGLIYLHDGTTPAGLPVIHAFPVEGCGAPTCSPISTIAVPAPPAETGYASFEVQLLSITDDGQLLLRRSWTDDRNINFGVDLVALSSEGAVDWLISMTDLGGVAAAGDTVFAVGQDQETPVGSGTLFAHSSSSTWRADVPALTGTPSVAGGLVYAEAEVAGGVGVAVFDGAGCGGPSCSPVKMLDAGPGDGGLYGISVTAGTVHVSKAGNPGGQLIAYAPTG